MRIVVVPDERGHVARDAPADEIFQVLPQGRPGDVVLDVPLAVGHVLFMRAFRGPIDQPSPNTSRVTPWRISLCERPSCKSDTVAQESMLIKPGATARPRTSSFAQARAVPRSPTAAIRSPRSATSAIWGADRCHRKSFRDAESRHTVRQPMAVAPQALQPLRPRRAPPRMRWPACRNETSNKDQPTERIHMKPRNRPREITPVRDTITRQASPPRWRRRQETAKSQIGSGGPGSSTHGNPPADERRNQCSRRPCEHGARRRLAPMTLQFSWAGAWRSSLRGMGGAQCAKPSSLARLRTAGMAAGCCWFRLGELCRKGGCARAVPAHVLRGGCCRSGLPPLAGRKQKNLQNPCIDCRSS